MNDRFEHPSESTLAACNGDHVPVSALLEPVLTTFKSRYKLALAAKGTSGKEVAAKVGVNQSTLSGVVTGRTKSKSLQIKICEVLGVSEGWLINGLGLPPFQNTSAPVRASLSGPVVAPTRASLEPPRVTKPPEQEDIDFLLESVVRDREEVRICEQNFKNAMNQLEGSLWTLMARLAPKGSKK